MSDIAICSDCKKPLGKHAQLGLLPSQETCVACTTARRVKHMLAMCPDERDHAWEGLSAFEQEFLASVRRQVAHGRTLSEKQFQVLERIYARV